MKNTLVIVSLAVCFLFGNCAPKDATVSDAKAVQVVNNASNENTVKREIEESVAANQDAVTYINDDLRFDSVSIEKKLSQDFNFSIRYPRLIDATDVDQARVRAFNRAAANIVNESFDNFDWLQEDSKNLEGFLNSSYEITYADANLVSVSYTTCTICCGAATAGCYAHVLNFDLRHGKAIKPEEFFQSRSNYLSTLYSYCEVNLSNSYGVNRIFGVKEDIPKNYKQLAITLQGIKVMFDECTYLPCNVGVHSVLVPYPIIKDKLNSRSYVATLAAQTSQK